MAIEHLKDTTSAVALGKEIVDLDKQITTLREQLAKHGGHTVQCKTKWHDYSTGTGWGRCDCGWAEIEKRLQ